MKQTLFIFALVTLCFTLLILGCSTKNLKVIADLPYSIREVSGTQMAKNSDLIWMVNDAGNSPILFGINAKGKIIKTIKVTDENNDWEDLTSDEKGNLYIGDFGNNKNERKNLTILKIKNEDLNSDTPIDAENISFYYPEQKKFPPKKKKRYFDCEAFFYLNDSLYLFTKSRVEEKHGKTTLYKIPAKSGEHEAIKIDSYQAPCDKITCWTTSADISPDNTKIALLTPTAILLFTDFEGTNFLKGKITEIKFDFVTQKESVFFKDNNTLYLTDEYTYGLGGNLYKYEIK